MATTLVTDPTLTWDPNGLTPLAGLVQFETSDPSRATLIVNNGASEWAVSFQELSTDHALPVYGLKPESSYTVKVVFTDEDGDSSAAPTVLSVDTPALPDDFPDITVITSDPAKMEPGYTLLNNLSTGTNDYAIIVDNEGNVVWYGDFEARNTKQLSDQEFDGDYDGDLIYRASSSGKYAIRDLLGELQYDGQIVDIDTKELTPIHHEMFVTENDTLLTLGRFVIPVVGYPTNAPSDDEPTPQTDPVNIADEPVVEFALDGTILNEWYLSDLIDTTRVAYSSWTPARDTGGALDWVHANAAIMDPGEDLVDPSDDSIIVSIRHQDAVISFTRAGELEWILGTHENWGPDYQQYLLDPVGDTFAWQYHQHAPMLTQNGDLLLFDNGNKKASPYDGIVPVEDAANYSRAVIYSIDEVNMTVSQTWEYLPTDPQIYASFVGDADEQPTTGNVLVTFGGTNFVDGVSSEDLGKQQNHARIIEVTADDTPVKVFDLEVSSADYRVTMYRSERIPGLYSSDVEVSDLDSFPMHVGDNADNVLAGTPLDDQMWGLDGADELRGGKGRDTIDGGLGNDKIGGNGGNDSIRGDDGNDKLWGGRGRDTLSGNFGDDMLNGGQGNDNLWGNWGNDVLKGGVGNDKLKGGQGDDCSTAGPVTTSCGAER
jgi:hypothetical protein